MSAKNKAADRAGRVEKLAKGVDQTFVRLVYLSPIALLALLLFDQARDYGGALILISLTLALVWAIMDNR
jgi:hypothetical protein